ncbi:hypothetical protein CHS0354_005767 [Potamilus streckersoni]|uniref:Pre-mRNA-splicing factor CWC25-like protein n=1 Tax=Potamilus streckersoni TaxID=2493646 RepID=A0AAE0SND8_9BIVA|nr:hypothetical protein CHS0354_005767 [Potamilus streckersoni]
MSKMDEDEKQKVKMLIQEKGKGDGKKLEWMYKEDKPDVEDYLLGKRIDKALEKQENSKEDDVGALFNERIQANIAMDMQTKMREDPLFAIRKKEEEAKRRLLQNPVKMKRLQQMIDQKKTERKEHKKAKKKHKNRDSDSDSDDDIMAKYLNIINRKQKSGNDGRQKSQSECQRENQRGRSPFLMEKGDKQQSRTGDRSKQWESNSHDEDDQRKEKNYKNREKKEGRNEDWRKREGRRDLESDHERHRQHGDIDTGRMQRDSNLDFDHCVNFHGNRKVHSSRKRRDSDSDNDSHSRNSDTSKQRKEWSESERAGYHRNKEKDQIGKQTFSDSEDDNYSSNRKDKRSGRHKHSDIDEENKEKRFDKRNFGLEYRHSSKETRKKQRHSDSEDNHHGKKQRHSDSEDDHHSNKRAKTGRLKSSSKSEDDRKSNDGQQKNKTYGYGLVMPRGVSPVRKFKRASSSDRSRSSKMSGSRSPSPKRMKPSPNQSKTRPLENKSGSTGRRVLSEEERKRRLEEMMDNAKWREDQRKQNVTRYREEEKREEEDQRKDFDSSHFLKPMISGHVEKSSVEDRLKRNKYNILRTNADLDRGFSKK